jgi:hypothetical protein
MELIDRYLQAVRFWLPRAQRDDLIAELSEDIRSQIEAREAELGRPVNDDEVAAILKQCGNPLLVAQRYLPQQYLIGPSLFPIYAFVLKLVAFIYVLPWLLFWLGNVLFSPAYRAQDPIHHLVPLGHVVASLLFAITLAFALVERSKVKFWARDDWDPRKLPAVRDTRLISRASSIADLAAGIGFVVWWAIHLQFRTVFEVFGTTVTLSPGWRYLLGGLLLVSTVTIGLSVVNLVLRRWTRFTAALRLVVDGVGFTLLCWWIKTGILANITGPNIPPEKALWVTHTINEGAAKAFVATVVVCLVIILVDLRRIIRAKTTVTRAA